MQDNTDYTYANSFQVLEPYMLYGDRSAMADPVQMQKDFVMQDMEYMQGMYPEHMKRLQQYVVSACDQLDYKNSPMYDEYPDRLMVNQITDSIARQISQDQMEAEELYEDSRNLKSVIEVEQQSDMESMEEVSQVQQVLPQGQRPPQGPPPWGPPPGQRPPQGPPPGQRPPWGPPPGSRPPQNTGGFWLNDIVKVLFLNEMHRRRCRTGLCF